MEIKSIRQLKDLFGERVFLRSDLNVPIEKGKINDDFKIISSLPTIRFLLGKKCKIIIATHLGRPLSVQDKSLSVLPIARRMEELLGKKISFVRADIGPEAEKAVSGLKEGEILFLENLRYYSGEEKNDKKFAQSLARLADIFVNDAFAVSHRKHASVCAITKYLPSYAGLLLENEIVNFKKILAPKRPLVAIIGGAKLETKASLLKKFIKLADAILVGGVLANNFFYALGYETGRSLISKKEAMAAKKFKSKKIVLPVDVLVNDRKDGSGRVKLKKIGDVGGKDIIFDIGPETVRGFSKIIKSAKTIIWNGPMGKIELNNYKFGTIAVARLVASHSSGRAFGVVGGGETIQILRETKMMDYVDWVSTGGGAMLNFLAGGEMPGLEGLRK